MLTKNEFDILALFTKAKNIPSLEELFTGSYEPLLTIMLGEPIP